MEEKGIWNPDLPLWILSRRAARSGETKLLNKPSQRRLETAHFALPRPSGQPAAFSNPQMSLKREFDSNAG
jgi:hypothetical protein